MQAPSPSPAHAEATAQPPPAMAGSDDGAPAAAVAAAAGFGVVMLVKVGEATANGTFGLPEAAIILVLNAFNAASSFASVFFIASIRAASARAVAAECHVPQGK